MTTYLATNPADTLVAGLMIGASLAVLGCIVLAAVRSAWAESRARKAEATVTESPEAREARLWDAEINLSLTLAEVEVLAQARLTSVADVVPIQRGAVD